MVWDLRSWRIPNRLIAAGLLQGYVVSGMMRGPGTGLASSLAGCVIPVAVLYVLFLIKALGAGDIKLLAVAGTFVGTDVVEVMIYSFFAGGVLCLFFLLKEFFLSITNRKRLSKQGFYLELRRSRVHFSVAVFAGIMCYLAVSYF